jgi:hypothetical protein
VKGGKVRHSFERKNLFMLRSVYPRRTKHALFPLMNEVINFILESFAVFGSCMVASCTDENASFCRVPPRRTNVLFAWCSGTRKLDRVSRSQNGQRTRKRRGTPRTKAKPTSKNHRYAENQSSFEINHRSEINWINHDLRPRIVFSYEHRILLHHLLFLMCRSMMTMRSRSRLLLCVSFASASRSFRLLSRRRFFLQSVPS